jgi:tetratricopeptide (TPR) repeat protein
MDLNLFNHTNYSNTSNPSPGLKSINVDHEYLECETMLAQADTLLKEKRTQESVELLFKLLQRNPQCGKAYNYLGWIYEVDYRNYTRAEEYYKNAIEYEPEYSASYLNYARLLSSCKRFDELTALLDMTLTISTISEESIYNEYAIMYEMQQNPEAAMNYYVKAAMTTFTEDRLAFYQTSINRCKTKLELKNLLSNH